MFIDWKDILFYIEYALEHDPDNCDDEWIDFINRKEAKEVRKRIFNIFKLVQRIEEKE